MARIVGRFCERVMLPKSAFDKRSFRWKKSGRAWVMTGCRKGGWKRGRCATGLRAHVLLVRSDGRCPMGGRSITKGLGAPPRKYPRTKPRVLTPEQQTNRDLLFKILAPDFDKHLRAKAAKKLNGARR